MHITKTNGGRLEILVNPNPRERQIGLKNFICFCYVKRGCTALRSFCRHACAYNSNKNLWDKNVGEI